MKGLYPVMRCMNKSWGLWSRCFEWFEALMEKWHFCRPFCRRIWQQRRQQRYQRKFLQILRAATFAFLIKKGFCTVQNSPNCCKSAGSDFPRMYVHRLWNPPPPLVRMLCTSLQTPSLPLLCVRTLWMVPKVDFYSFCLRKVYNSFSIK